MTEAARSPGKHLNPSSSLVGLLSAPSEALDAPTEGVVSFSEDQRLQLWKHVHDALTELERARILELRRARRARRSKIMLVPRVLLGCLFIAYALCSLVSLVWLGGAVLLLIVKFFGVLAPEFFLVRFADEKLSYTWGLVSGHPVAAIILIINAYGFGNMMDNGGFDDMWWVKGDREPSSNADQTMPCLDEHAVTRWVQLLTTAASFESCLRDDPYRTADRIVWRRGGDTVASLSVAELSLTTETREIENLGDGKFRATFDEE